MKSIYTIAFGFLLQACGSTEPPHQHGQDDHADHFHASSSTVNGEHAELFVEFEPLVVGHPAEFTAHFTERETFKPVKEGRVTVRMGVRNHRVHTEVMAPAKPGIFVPMLQPTQSGVFDLWFILATESYTDSMVVPGVEVFRDATAADLAAHANDREEDENADVITFKKEQVWKIDFSVAPAQRQSIQNVIRVGGEILPSRGAEAVVTAKTNGVVLLDLENTIEGKYLTRGSSLFTIASGGMTEDNFETQYQQAEARLTQAQLEFTRQNELFESGVIARGELEDVALLLALAEAEFERISVHYGEGGIRVDAPMDGFLKDVLVTAGEYVEVGDGMALLAQNEKLTLRADLPQNAYPMLRHIETAYFKMAGDVEARAISDYNGRLLSYGKSVRRDEPFIPVLFEIDNRGDLLAGMFVEMFIALNGSEGAEEEQVLVVPHTALLEEYGRYAVYVQVGGESFLKRDVEIGTSNGVQTEIMSGLVDGDLVVSRGAYQVKMSSMSASIPAHGHVH